MKINYPIVGAAGYCGLLVWHGGLSGSAPLTVATTDHFLASLIGVISVEHTVFSSTNMITTLLLIWYYTSSISFFGYQNHKNQSNSN